MTETTMLPKGGTVEFYQAVERLRSAPVNCTNLFELATVCCKNCNQSINCEDCIVQTLGDLRDPYRQKIQQNTPTGMYSSGIYRDKNGEFHYAHPQGSG